MTSAKPSWTSSSEHCKIKYLHDYNNYCWLRIERLKIHIIRTDISILGLHLSQVIAISTSPHESHCHHYNHCNHKYHQDQPTNGTADHWSEEIAWQKTFSCEDKKKKN